MSVCCNPRVNVGVGCISQMSTDHNWQLLALFWVLSILLLIRWTREIFTCKLLPVVAGPIVGPIAVDPLWTRCEPAVDPLWTHCETAVNPLSRPTAGLRCVHLTLTNYRLANLGPGPVPRLKAGWTWSMGLGPAHDYG